MTHFPIALITTACILQILVLWKPGWISRSAPLWLFGIAVGWAFIASLSGQDAASVAIAKMELVDAPRAAIDTHERFATFTVWGSLVTLIGWVWLYFNFPGDRWVDWIAFALLILLSLSVVVTANLGGQLVMRFGIGVGL